MDRDLDGSLKPIDYIIGVGRQEVSLRVIERLATHRDMENAWARLEKAAQAAKRGRTGAWLANRPNESISCAIARRCVASLHAVATEPPITRRTWKKRYQELAASAQHLRTLLQPDVLLHPESGRIAWLFSDEALHTLASEIYGYLGPHAYEPIDPSTLEDGPSPPMPQEVIEAENAHWDKEVQQWEYWIRSAMDRSDTRLEGVLEQLEKFAERMAGRPPPSGHSTYKARRVSAIISTLSHYFVRMFRQPLDEVTAAIAQVLTGVPVSAETVKTRRHRWMQHRERNRR